MVQYKSFIDNWSKYYIIQFDITTQHNSDYLLLVSLKLLLLATRRKKGPSCAGLKVEGTIS